MPNTTLTIRIPEELKAAVETAAKSDDRSVTSFVIHALRDALRPGTLLDPRRDPNRLILIEDSISVIDLALRLGVAAGDVLAALREMGYSIIREQDSIDDNLAIGVAHSLGFKVMSRRRFLEILKTCRDALVHKHTSKKPSLTVEIGAHISVADLARKLKMRAPDLLRVLWKSGHAGTMANSALDADTAMTVVHELGHKPLRVKE